MGTLFSSRRLFIGCLAACLGLGACSAKTEPKGVDLDAAGADSDDDSNHGSAGTGGNSVGASGASSSCTAKGTPVKIASVYKYVYDFANVGGDLYLLEPTDTSVLPGRVRHLVPATGEDSTLYTTDEDPSQNAFDEHSLASLIATEKYLYFFKRGDDGGNALMQLPRAGGTPTRIAPNLEPFDDGNQIVGADEQSVYVFEVHSANELVRISLADGTQTIIAEHDGLGFTDMQILNGRFYYSADEGLDGIYSAPLDASAPADVRITDGCTPFAMSATPAGIVCGDAFDVTSTPLDGGSSKILWALKDGAVDVSLPDDGFVYLRSYAQQDSTLRQLPITGGDAPAIACHRDAIGEIRFDTSHVYWLEGHSDDSRDLVMLDK